MTTSMRKLAGTAQRPLLLGTMLVACLIAASQPAAAQNLTATVNVRVILKNIHPGVAPKVECRAYSSYVEAQQKGNQLGLAIGYGGAAVTTISGSGGGGLTASGATVLSNQVGPINVDRTVTVPIEPFDPSNYEKMSNWRCELKLQFKDSKGNSHSMKPDESNQFFETSSVAGTTVRHCIFGEFLPGDDRGRVCP